MMKNKLLERFIFYSLGSYIAVIIGFISTPIVTRLLSPSEFGIYSLIMVWVNLISILVMLGFDHGYQRYFHEVKVKEKFNLFKTCISYSLILYLILLLIVFLFRENIEVLLKINDNIIIFILLLNFLTIINRYCGITLVMQQQMQKYSLIQILAQILNIIFILYFYYFYKNSYKILLYSTILVVLFSTSGYIFFTQNFFIVKSFKLDLPKKEFFCYSIPMALTMGLNWIFQSVDKISISYYSTAQELGYYSAAFKIISILIVIQTSFTTFWNSISYEKYNKNPEEKEFFEKNALYLTFFLIIISLILLLMRGIIVLLLGNHYEKSIEIIPFLLLMPIMQSISEITGVGINFSKKTKYNAYISLSTAVINILGNIVLVVRFGAKGAAISTGISYILFFILRTYFSIKFIKYRFDFKKITFGILILILNIIMSTIINFKKITFIFCFISIMCVIFLFKEQLIEIKYQITKILKEKRRLK